MILRLSGIDLSLIRILLITLMAEMVSQLGETLYEIIIFLTASNIKKTYCHLPLSLMYVSLPQNELESW